MPFFIDYYYIILILPALLFGLWAQTRVKGAYSKYSRIQNSRGMTGAEAAQYVLEQSGVYDVTINTIGGTLSDNYNPADNTINLSSDIYSGTSVAAVGIACHEAGHAVQHAVGYFPIKIRETIIPITKIGSVLYLPIILLGLFFNSYDTVQIGILLFATITVFQLVTLPVEFNASNRAIQAIEGGGLLYGDELSGAKSVLKAAALTYIAALLSSVAQLLRLVLMFGGRRRD